MVNMIEEEDVCKKQRREDINCTNAVNNLKEEEIITKRNVIKERER